MVGDVFGTVLRWCEADRGITVAEELQALDWADTAAAATHIAQVRAVRLSDGSIMGRVQYASEQAWRRLENTSLEYTGEGVSFLHGEINALAETMGLEAAFHDHTQSSCFFIAEDPKKLLGYLCSTLTGYTPEDRVREQPPQE